MPAKLVKEDVLTDDRLPKGVLTLVTIQIACAIWTRRYTASGAGGDSNTEQNRLSTRGPWPQCDDRDPNSLILYQFVHGSWLHLIANALTQIVFGLDGARVAPKDLGRAQRGRRRRRVDMRRLRRLRRRHRRVGRRLFFMGPMWEPFLKTGTVKACLIGGRGLLFLRLY